MSQTNVKRICCVVAGILLVCLTASPAETALSMLAEILAVRAGREGGRLRDSRERIHAEPAQRI